MPVMLFCVTVSVMTGGLTASAVPMPEWAQRVARFLPPRRFGGIVRRVSVRRDRCRAEGG